MAYIVDGELLRGGKKSWYVDLWEGDDPNAAYEFHEVATEKERDALIAELESQGDQRLPDTYGEEER